MMNANNSIKITKGDCKAAKVLVWLLLQKYCDDLTSCHVYFYLFIRINTPKNMGFA